MCLIIRECQQFVLTRIYPLTIFFFPLKQSYPPLERPPLYSGCRVSGQDLRRHVVLLESASLSFATSATMPNPPPVVTDSARARCPATLEGCVCSIAPCQCLQIRAMISALGGVMGSYPLHVFDHLHCTGVSHISKGSTHEGNLCQPQLGFCLDPSWQRRAEAETTIFA